MLKIGHTFSEVGPNDVVYFSASWCGPCRQLRPQYARASVLDADRNYYLFDVDELSQTEDGQAALEQYGIQSIPRIFVNDTEILARSAQDIVTEVTESA